MLMIVVMLVVMVMAVLMLLCWGCIQLLFRSLSRQCVVCFCHFSRVQFNAFQRRP